MNPQIESFKHALNGLKLLVKTEVHFKMHVISAILVIAFGLWQGITTTEWIWISTATIFVFVAEGFNTLIEKICDLIDTSYNSSIKNIKDVAAGLVLLTSIYAVIIGIWIFGF